MVPFLTSYWPLVALVAVPALVAIYLFQRRFRAREVSSLMLWESIRQPSLGGRTREPLRLPLTFWLELLAIVLLALAAAGPLIPRWSRRRPLVIVLDDSLSMRAGARQRGAELVTSMLARRAHDPIHVVFAGATPQLAGDAALREWSCGAPSADLDAAIGLATQIGGPSALVLVVTDHPPDRKLESGRLEWRAFGNATPNLAFAAAARTGDRVLVEVASYAATPRETTLTLRSGKRILTRTRITLSPNGRLSVGPAILPAQGQPITATIDDETTFDNSVVLLPDDRPPVRVAVDIANEKLRESVERALDATGRVVRTGAPALRIADSQGSVPLVPPLPVPVPLPGFSETGTEKPGMGMGTGTGKGNSVWNLEIHSSNGNAGFIGPYVIDRTHPLAEGLALDGIVWGAQRGALGGTPVVLVGNQPLLTDEELAGGVHRLQMRFDPAISNLQRSPAWPALIWNLVAWRASRAPGVHTANVILGSEAAITLRDASENVSITAPDGGAQTLASKGTDVVVATTQPGIWSVRSGSEQYRFAANALIAAESDLSRAASGKWGGWSDDVLVSSGYQNIAWALLLVALAALVIHQIVSRGGLRSPEPREVGRPQAAAAKP